MRWMDRTLVYSFVEYGLCVDERAFRKALRKLKQADAATKPFLSTPQSHATAHLMADPHDRQVIIVCIHPNPVGITIQQVNAMLVHEAVHIWQCIKDHIGEDAPGAEFEAYSIQAIAQNLMVSYDEQVARLAKKAKKAKKAKT